MSGQRWRKRRRKRPRIRLRRAMFVLPNLFTISSVFCGFYAIVLSSGDPGPEQLYRATVAIFFGNFFDMTDGRVARLTRTQSDFGVQLDSLADMVTFGVAPAILVYKWGLVDLGMLGALVAFAYVACAAMRLARFNVIAARSGGGSADFFTGLPTPLAAAVLVSLVMFHQRQFSTTVTREVHILILVAVLSYLMVSNVRYRSLKGVKPTALTFNVFLMIMAIFLILALWVRPSFALLAFVSAYVAYGLFEEVIFFRRRRRERLVTDSQPLDTESSALTKTTVENAET